MTVILGPSPTPTWNGSFSMGSGANSLNFGAVGTIGTAGQLVMTSLSSVPAYALTANGTTYGPGTLSAQQLVTRTFFHKAANRYASLAESLRQAQLELIEGQAGTAYAHPFYWAPFSLYGDPSQ